MDQLASGSSDRSSACAKCSDPCPPDIQVNELCSKCVKQLRPCKNLACKTRLQDDYKAYYCPSCVKSRNEKWVSKESLVESLDAMQAQQKKELEAFGERMMQSLAYALQGSRSEAAGMNSAPSAGSEWVHQYVENLSRREDTSDSGSSQRSRPAVTAAAGSAAQLEDNRSQASTRFSFWRGRDDSASLMGSTATSIYVPPSKQKERF